MGRESAKALTYHANKVHNDGVTIKRYDDVKELYIQPSFFVASKGSYPLFQPKKNQKQRVV